MGDVFLDPEFFLFGGSTGDGLEERGDSDGEDLPEPVGLLWLWALLLGISLMP